MAEKGGHWVKSAGGGMSFVAAGGGGGGASGGWSPDKAWGGGSVQKVEGDNVVRVEQGYAAPGLKRSWDTYAGTRRERTLVGTFSSKSKAMQAADKWLQGQGSVTGTNRLAALREQKRQMAERLESLKKFRKSSTFEW